MSIHSPNPCYRNFFRIFSHFQASVKHEFQNKQVLKSAISIKANVRKATNAQSSKDFIHKLAISQKECDETIYWLELMKETQYISEIKFKEMEQDAVELLKMIRSSIITVKKKMNI